MQIDQFSSFLEGCSRDGRLGYNTVKCNEFG
jgi:hypothetical protein